MNFITIATNRPYGLWEFYLDQPCPLELDILHNTPASSLGCAFDRKCGSRWIGPALSFFHSGVVPLQTFLPLSGISKFRITFIIEGLADSILYDLYYSLKLQKDAKDCKSNCSYLC
jgi:hypothetical protein